MPPIEVCVRGLDSVDFYTYVLSKLLAEKILTRSSRILVVCGEKMDHGILSSLGFEDVTISNLSARSSADNKSQYAPYEWTYQDAEALSYPDCSFDFVIVHSGLHHLRCPQKGIVEMYRVASSGILGFEPLRNLFTLVGVKMGFGQEYETAAVYFNDCRCGGVEDSAIPNYVYRFTKGDIARTIQSYAPIREHGYRFWCTTRIPVRLQRLAKKRYVVAVRAAQPLLVLLGRAFPCFANNMAFLVTKREDSCGLFPWLQRVNDSIVPDRQHLEQIYGPAQQAVPDRP